MTRGNPAQNGRAVKARGRSFENHVAQQLRDATGAAIERHGSRYFGSGDRGDLDTKELGVVVQVKNTGTQAMLRVLDEAEQQAGNAGLDDYLVVFRNRRGHRYGPHRKNAWVFPEELALRLLQAANLTISEEVSNGRGCG